MIGLEIGDKFAILAVDRCSRSLTAELRLSDGTDALTTVPTELTETWRRWLGEARMKSLTSSNLVLVRKKSNSQPGNLDEEHEQLKREIFDTFCLLQLSGPLQYQDASILLGRADTSGVITSQVIQLQRFRPTSGTNPFPVTPQRLEEAVAARRVRERLRASGDYVRFKRGIRILVQAISEFHGSERLHQFVRALEALMIPAISKTRKQFVRRCKMFTEAQPGTGFVIGQIYDMRSDVEHVHELSRSIRYFPEGERERVALLRARQIETLACSAYRLLHSDDTLLRHFETDESIQLFWTQDEPVIRQKLAGRTVDLLGVS